MPETTYSRPPTSEYPAYFDQYLAHVTEDDPVGVMAAQIDELTDLLGGLPPGKADFAYAPDKWTVKQIIGHLSDTERVMAYRALRFARGDQAELPGFDENAWMPPSGFADRTLADVTEEWVAVRRATIALFAGLPAHARGAAGIANGKPLSVRAVAFMIPGHVRHHRNVIKARYL